MMEIKLDKKLFRCQVAKDVLCSLFGSWDLDPADAKRKAKAAVMYANALVEELYPEEDGRDQ